MTSSAATLPVPGRWPRRVAAPLLAGVGAVGGALIAQVVFDPFRQDVPLCPVHLLTGLYCPGCGMTRAVHALLDGNVLLALHNNVLIAVALPIAILLWARWFLGALRGARRALRARPAPALPSVRTVVLAVVLVLAFAILRNLPPFAFLAPTSLVGA